MSVKTTGSILLLAIIALAVFTSAAVLIQQVPIESVPELLLPVWEYIVTVFSLAPVITVIAFGRNILGFLVNYFKENHQEEYDFDKLGETLTLYIGVITTLLGSIKPIADFLPEPYNQIVAAIIAVGASTIIVLDLVKKQLAELGQAIRA